ncbi:Mediator of DNA damage checkpoint protein 1, partial [Podila humilis]
ILGSSEQENFLFDTLSASADVSGPHSIRDQPAVIEPEHVESTQPLAAVQIEDDAPTHIQNFATYLPEVVSNTQSTQEVPNTLSLSRSSRAESAEAVSQEYTQVYPLNVTAVTAEHLYSNTTRIPSTPTDLLNEREYSKDSEDHKVSNETKEDDSTSVIPHTQEDQIEESLEQSTLEPAPLSGPSTASEGMSMDQPLDVLEPGVATSGPGASTEEVSTTTAPSSPARSPSLSKATNTTPQPVTDTSSQRTVSPPPTPQEREQSPGESSTRPTQGRDHSPKHGMDGDSDSDEPLKRARNIKRESTDEGSFSLRRATPSRILSRRSTTDLDHRPCVGFSCGDKSQLLTRYETIVKQLHWTKSEDNFSVLVFSSASRTAKFMMSIVKGIPIVSTEWLDECSKQRSYVPWEDFLFKGQELEEKYGFDLQNTCVIAKDNRALGIYLFSGLQFYFVVKQGASKKILEDGFLNTTLVKESLTPLVDVCGGKVIRKEPKEEDKEITVVIGPEPLPSALPDVSWDKTQSLIRRGFKVFTKEFILSTILQQKTDFKLYQIPPDDSASTNSGPSTRKRM